MAWTIGSEILPEDCERWDLGSITKEERTKLAGIETGAQKNREIASSVEAEDGINNTKVMTPARTKSAILKLAPLPAKATPSLDGLMSKEDKTKLNGVASGANNYTHPANHPPEIISQNTTNRFVTDVEKARWDGKSNLALGTTSTTAFRGDQGKVAYDHSQLAHAPSDAQRNRPLATKEQAEAGIDTTTSMTPLRTKEAILKLAPLPGKATPTTDGLMSKEDFNKLARVNDTYLVENTDLFTFVKTLPRVDGIYKLKVNRDGVTNLPPISGGRWDSFAYMDFVSSGDSGFLNVTNVSEKGPSINFFYFSQLFRSKGFDLTEDHTTIIWYPSIPTTDNGNYGPINNDTRYETIIQATSFNRFMKSASYDTEVGESAISVMPIVSSSRPGLASPSLVGSAIASSYSQLTFWGSHPLIKTNSKFTILSINNFRGENATSREQLINISGRLDTKEDWEDGIEVVSSGTTYFDFSGYNSQFMLKEFFDTNIQISSSTKTYKILIYANEKGNIVFKNISGETIPKDSNIFCGM